jgi:hypothetical protein
VGFRIFKKTLSPPIFYGVPYGAIIVTPVVNRPALYPIILPTTVTLYRFILRVTTTGGNMDLGIYDNGLSARYRTGSIVVPAAGPVLQEIPQGISLAAGRYYLAFVNDGALARFGGFSSGGAQAWLRAQIRRATPDGFPLPASIGVSASTPPTSNPALAVSTEPV